MTDQGRKKASITSLNDFKAKRVTDNILNAIFNDAVVTSFIESFPTDTPNPLTKKIDLDNKTNIQNLLITYTNFAMGVQKPPAGKSTFHALFIYRDMIKNSFEENSTGVVTSPKFGNKPTIIRLGRPEDAVDPVLSAIHNIIKKNPPKPLPKP